MFTIHFCPLTESYNYIKELVFLLTVSKNIFDEILNVFKDEFTYSAEDSRKRQIGRKYTKFLSAFFFLE